jgi:hypothetical protein
MKISKGVYEYEYKGVKFQIDNGFKNWAIYYNSDNVDACIYNEDSHADRVHCLKYVAIQKAKQYIDELICMNINFYE